MKYSELNSHQIKNLIYLPTIYTLYNITKNQIFIFSATKQIVEPKNSHYYKTVIRGRNFLATKKKPSDPVFSLVLRFLRNQAYTCKTQTFSHSDLSIFTNSTHKYNITKNQIFSFSATKKTVEPKNSHHYQTVIRVLPNSHQSSKFLSNEKAIRSSLFFSQKPNKHKTQTFSHSYLSIFTNSTHKTRKLETRAPNLAFSGTMRTVTLIFGEKEPKTQRFGVRARDQSRTVSNAHHRVLGKRSPNAAFSSSVRSTASNLMSEEETEPPKRSAFELNENSEQRITVLWVRQGKILCGCRRVVRRKEPCFLHVHTKRRGDFKLIPQPLTTEKSVARKPRMIPLSYPMYSLFHKRKRDGKYGNTVKIAKRRRWIGAEVAPVRCNSGFSQVSVFFSSFLFCNY